MEEDMKVKSLRKNHAFLIDIKDTQNGSWQGSIKWLNGKKEENFRSSLEMIMLINSALEQEDMKED